MKSDKASAFALRGRLEAVTIEVAVSNELALGRLREDRGRVAVNYARSHVGSEIVACFQIMPKNEDSCGSFVTSTVPRYFNGYNNSEFVLTGLFPNSNGVPNHDQINEFYEPSEIPIVIYFSREGIGYVRSVNKVSKVADEVSLRRIKLCNPNLSRRIVLAEDEGHLEMLEIELMQKELYPMRMEPIRTQ